MIDVYLIRENGRPVYVGSTQQGYARRFYCHAREKHGLLHRKMQRQPGAFAVELLAQASRYDHGLLMEYRAIDVYGTHRTAGGYNVWRREKGRQDRPKRGGRPKGAAK